jgi:hypothetical protein
MVHGGLFMMLRQVVERLRYAPPWKQAVFALGLTVAGIGVLIELHTPMSIVLIALGAVFVRSAARHARHARRKLTLYGEDHKGANSTGPPKPSQR